MKTDADLEILVATGLQLIDDMRRIGTRIQHGRTMHMQHADFCERVTFLAEHLDSALALSLEQRYPSALAVLRTALEHQLMDRLVMLGSVYVARYPVPPGGVAVEERRLAELKAGARPDIRSWKVENNRFTVRISGLHSQGREARSPVISRYYFTLDRYDPFVGKPWLQRRLARPFEELEDAVRMAEEAQAIWNDGLKQSRLVTALTINRLLSSAERVQVEVHMTFLGAFTHAAQRAYDLCYGRDRPAHTRRFDHYSHELVALYVVTLACAELRTLRRALRRRPSVDIAGWTDLDERISAAKNLASYLWFLGDGPTEYDRIAEVHTRVGGRLQRRRRRPVDPADVRSIRYYRNPMERLIRLHSSFQEFSTGIAYRSPFERPDARLRL